LQIRSLKGDYAFRRLKRGHSGYSKLLSIRWRADQEGKIRVGIIVTKKVGNAVTRNLIRRRLREAFRVLLNSKGIAQEAKFRQDPSASLIIIVKPDAAGQSYKSLAKALENSLSRAGFLV
jgi:ribonuclease P protein component